MKHQVVYATWYWKLRELILIDNTGNDCEHTVLSTGQSIKVAFRQLGLASTAALVCNVQTATLVNLHTYLPLLSEFDYCSIISCDHGNHTVGNNTVVNFTGTEVPLNYTPLHQQWTN